MCCNLRHLDKTHGRTPAPLPEPKACSRCLCVVYCSTECQTEDWLAIHRFECDVFRSERKEVQEEDLWIRHATRFHFLCVAQICLRVSNINKEMLQREKKMSKSSSDILVNPTVHTAFSENALIHPFNEVAPASQVRGRLEKLRFWSAKRFDAVVVAVREREGLSMVAFRFQYGALALHVLCLAELDGNTSVHRISVGTVQIEYKDEASRRDVTIVDE
ncbi:hypothetical protein CC2G_013414 [Coprinopsis cinerea AmutBmut pab1-1]|nr:hypothetical protein CC2G_013414 [Coprinopsis cinerea AmutBmut pab1-1]